MHEAKTNGCGNRNRQIRHYKHNKSHSVIEINRKKINKFKEDLTNQPETCYQPTKSSWHV